MSEVRSGALGSGWLVIAVETTASTLADPGIGTSVPTPSVPVLVAAWIVGIVILAIFWAASRK